MKRLLLIIGVLASLSAREPGHPLFEFTLEETAEQLAARFDRPPNVAGGQNYRILNFHALTPTVIEEGLNTDWLANVNNAACNGKYAYVAYFDADNKLISLLHQPDRRLPVSLFFPEGSYQTYSVQKPGNLTFTYKVRKLDARRTLAAVFYSADVKYIDQVLLVRSTHLTSAYPDLAEKLK